MGPRRVVALTVDTERLVAIRKVRAKILTGELVLRYATPGYVEREKVWFQKILRQGVWPVVDVTFRSIEETAAELMEMVRPRRRGF